MLNGKLLSNAFPINKVEVFFDDLDHSTFLGFTWERVGAGRVPVGLDTSDTDFNTIGETGGEKTHTLTTDEIPSHHHTYTRANADGYQYGAGNLSNVRNSQSTQNTSDVGGGQAHNNLQPYIVMAFWKRIA